MRLRGRDKNKGGSKQFWILHRCVSSIFYTQMTYGWIESTHNLFYHSIRYVSPSLSSKPYPTPPQQPTSSPPKPPHPPPHPSSHPPVRLPLDNPLSTHSPSHPKSSSQHGHSAQSSSCISTCRRRRIRMRCLASRAKRRGCRGSSGIIS